MPMNESALLSLVNQAEKDAVNFNGEYSKRSDELLERYLAEPYGNEVEGRSSVVATDIQDVIEADMASLARTFLGQRQILEFKPNNRRNKDDVREADEKTNYIHWIIKNQKGSFKKLHDWMKAADIQRVAALKFYYEETKRVKEEEWSGLDEIEAQQIKAEIEETADEYEILEEEQDEDGFSLKIKTTTKKCEYIFAPVPVEEFIISKNATCKDDAVLIGDRKFKTRGQLLADGFKREVINQLERKNRHENTGSKQRQIRHKEESGDGEPADLAEWASELVEVCEYYVRVDYDQDGIPELRRILKSGQKILENEPHEIAPYALLSAILMPHQAIGRSRAEITEKRQEINTVLHRHLLDNIYAAGNIRYAINDEVTNVDDFLADEFRGIVRTKADNPLQAVQPLITPYIGDTILQVIQYQNQLRAEQTGNLLVTQGLDADNLHKETATRFEGIEDHGKAKIELVARVFAETGFRELYEGICWLVSRYQKSDIEIEVLGKQLTVNPSRWRYDHTVMSNVGLAAGDEEQQLANLSGLYQIQTQLKAEGSPLADDKKRYNTLKLIMKAMDMPETSAFFNDPEVPEEVLMAQVEQLTFMVGQLQQMAQNPLAQVEQVRQQGTIAGKQLDAQVKMAEIAQQSTNTDAKNALELKKHLDEIMARLTELELKYGQNVPGSAV